MIAYIESSAAGKLLIEELESEALMVHLDQLVAESVMLVSCALLETELRRIAVRATLPERQVEDVLNRFEIMSVDVDTYRHAGRLPGIDLRSLDAIHVASALRIRASTLLTYDSRQTEAARSFGLEVISPGRA